jgi:uncharacterized protein YaaN involved in tellurite resistance
MFAAPAATVTDVTPKAPILNLDPPVFHAPILAGRPTISPTVQKKFSLACGTKSELDISEFGTAAGKEVAALADTILQKTTTGKMSDFGDGITQILALTSTINPNDLNIDKSKGFIGRAVGFFKKKRVEVMAQFEDTSKSIQKIADDLSQRQNVMKQDNGFLDQLYEKNMQEYHDLSDSIEAAQAYMDQALTVEYELKKAQVTDQTDQFTVQAINELEQKIKRWEKQIDRLKRMQQVALLTAPEIRTIQAGNVTMVEKFNDIMHTTLPAWKKQMSMTILALRQKENAELGNTIDNKTNEFFRKAASLNNQNAIAVAKASERSTVDIETLEFMQQQLIDSVKQVKSIQEQGRTDRQAASQKIDQLRNEMKQEMLSWSKG